MKKVEAYCAEDGTLFIFKQECMEYEFETKNYNIFFNLAKDLQDLLYAEMVCNDKSINTNQAMEIYKLCLEAKKQIELLNKPDLKIVKDDNE